MNAAQAWDLVRVLWEAVAFAETVDLTPPLFGTPRADTPRAKGRGVWPESVSPAESRS